MRQKLLCALVLSMSLLFSLLAFSAETITPINDKLSVTDDGLLILELPEGLIQPETLFDLKQKTLRFSPTNSGYRAQVVASEFDDSTGAAVSFGVPVNIQNFQFEFSGSSWSSIYVNGSGSVSFGKPDTNAYSGFSQYSQLIDQLGGSDTPPTIAPFFRIMSTSTAQVSQSADQVIVTWSMSPFSLQTPHWEFFSFIPEPQFSDIQLVLNSDGSIEFNYKNLLMEDGIVGLFPSTVAVNASSQNLQSFAVNFDIANNLELPSKAFEVFRYASLPSMAGISCLYTPVAGDNYDFLVAFSQFRLDKPLAGSGMYLARNSTEGIGKDLFDNGAGHCSDNRLKGVIATPLYIDSSLGTPAGPNGLNDNYNYAMSALGHEFTHTWAAHVSAMVDGNEVNLGDPAHWIANLHAPAAHPWKEDRQASLMGGGYWNDNGDGTFTRLADAFFIPASGPSYLDLYLMGLLPASDVPDFFKIDNLSLIDSSNPDEPRYTGTRVNIVNDDIIAANGARNPPFSESQRDFKVAFLYLLEPGTEVNSEKLNRLSAIQAEFSDYWSFVTGGVSTMNSQFSTTSANASFNAATNQLSIPVLTVGAENYSLLLSLSSLEAAEFQLESFEPLAAAEYSDASTFENGLVVVPRLQVGETIYRVEFTLTSDNPVTLRLVSAAEISP